MIICGDAGFVWDNSNIDLYWRKWISKKTYTTLCCLGNHENYDLIEEFPIVEKWGGKVRQITPSLFYAVNGQIYTIGNRKLLFINGADSHDKEFRKPHISWWEQERITPYHVSEAIESLEKVNGEVDYVISHTGGTEPAKACGYKPTISDKYLDDILAICYFQHHYCGHMHRDMDVDDKTTIMYNSIKEIT